MSKTEQIGVYYIASAQSLLIGLSPSTIQTVKQPLRAIEIPFDEVLAATNAPLANIKTLLITTHANFDAIIANAERDDDTGLLIPFPGK
jgi:hypothetical protein